MEEECIFCFLTSMKQKQLRKLAQIQEEKFENILEKYKGIFIKEFSISLNKALCSTHKKIFRSYDIVNVIKTISKQEIDDFFKEIIEIYKKWISGEAFTAIQRLDTLLKKENLICLTEEEFEKNKFYINSKVFFRGRKAEKSIFNCYDMFHIPYDKRYLVGNQRFSLSGYPLLYLNASIDGVVAELDINDNNFDDYVFSAFHFNKQANVYTLENPFKNFFLKKYDKRNNKLYLEEEITKEKIKNKMYKFILASICCFEKRIQHKKQEQLGRNIFYEEYVIPQALTQVLKLHNYDGVYYPSTRVNVLEKGLFRDETFNLAYFPKYRERHYDDELYANLDITVPISYENIQDIIKEKIDFKELLFNIKASELSTENQFKFFQLLDIFVKKLMREEENKEKKLENFNKKSYLMNEMLFNNFLLKSILQISSQKENKDEK